MTSREPSHSIHVAVVRLVDPIIRGEGAGPAPVPDDSESAYYWAYLINVAWGLLAFACILVMGVVGVSLQKLVSDGATAVAVCAGMFAIFFCLAGCANTLWRQYVILPEARRLAQRGEHEASEAALRRSLPPNSSVVFQAAVGILAGIIAAVSL